jgi:SagB-type dehydrogenase family enzyme
MRRIMLAFAGAFAAVMLLASVCPAADTPKPIVLPEPNMKGGMPLMEALKARSTSRDFDSRDLPPQVLSDLLWAAFGINRPESGKRTAPSAMNRQEADIYVAMKSGLYMYNAAGHRLEPVLGEDIREATGMQPFVKDAPVNLVFVADFARMGKGSEENKKLYAAADLGFISQNVYLFCASEGLATVVRGSFDREKLAGVMGLRPEQYIVLTQTVGYPGGGDR